MFHPDYPVVQLRGAPYNPRVISEADALRLRQSIATLGMLRPVIATSDGLLIAGHQRTTQLRALGVETTPAVVLDEVNETDEVRFNQLHNASDLELGGNVLQIASHALQDAPVGDWLDVPFNQVQGNLKSGYAAKKSEILRLLSKYGPWGACVVTQGGEVLTSGLYAAACVTLRLPVRVRVVADKDKATVLRFFNASYGRFSYEHLPKTTWVQSLAQMSRLRHEDETQVGGKSTCYERAVLPILAQNSEKKPNQKLRILDFGAGQMDYVQKLQKLGVAIRGVEFYYRSGLTVDVRAVHRQIDGLCRDLKQYGRFDVVICDSVVNSVDSQQSEADVLWCLNALCKPGGTIIFSGRSRHFVDSRENGLSTDTDHRNRYVQFLDENGLTAMMKSGVWLYQKFHSLVQIQALALRHIGPEYFVQDRLGRRPKNEISTSSWSVVGVKAHEGPPPEVESALSREFNLPLPDGTRYGRSEDIVEAWHIALQKEGLTP